LVLVSEVAVLERFWWKHSQKPLGVNVVQWLESECIKFGNQEESDQDI